MESVSKTSGGTTSAILAIIGGSLMLAGGVFALSMFSVWGPQVGMMNGWGGQMMGFRGGGWGMMFLGNPGLMWWSLGTMSAIAIGSGAVSIAGGLVVQRKPESSAFWGTAILVASIVALIDMSGFFIGPILGIIGGILALAKN